MPQELPQDPAVTHPDDHPEPARSTGGAGESFGAVMTRRLSRRDLLEGGAAAAALVVVGQGRGVPTELRRAGDGALPSLDPPTIPRRATVQSATPFEPLPPGTGNTLQLADAHVADLLIRWGDPILPDAPPFASDAQSAAAQAGQFGYNCDFIAYLPTDPDSRPARDTDPSAAAAHDPPPAGLLVVNHEYCNPELMFPAYDRSAPTPEQVAIQKAAHGLTIVTIQRTADPEGNGPWMVDRNAPANRRITADTPIALAGPAAGSPALRTSADPQGLLALGTLNNCAGGVTPWGTVLSAEENLQSYFGGIDRLPSSDPRAADHRRYGIAARSSWGWERHDPRFDVAAEPNEPNRFGWIVEVDPHDPRSTPIKRTALGRFRHEGASTVVAPSGRLAVYSGDDALFEYIYKFISDAPWRSGDDAHNSILLDEGTLHVARFDDDGTGEWLPLRHGTGPLTAANGFASQADVLVRTRQAADALGATKMDRPEDIEVSPESGKVYLVLTNNPERGAADRPAPDAANPRAPNPYGHVLELQEAGDDHAATTFRWQVLLLCGDPADPSTYYAGYPKDRVSAIAAPDNLTFDAFGNLWLATDGQPVVLGAHDSLYRVPVEGPERGAARRFLNAVPGAEVCGPAFTPDNRTLFLSVQHPGEGSTLASPSTRWPDGAGPPRPTVIAIRQVHGGMVGYKDRLTLEPDVKEVGQATVVVATAPSTLISPPTSGSSPSTPANEATPPVSAPIPNAPPTPDTLLPTLDAVPPPRATGRLGLLAAASAAAIAGLLRLRRRPNDENQPDSPSPDAE